MMTVQQLPTVWHEVWSWLPHVFVQWTVTTTLSAVNNKSKNSNKLQERQRLQSLATQLLSGNNNNNSSSSSSPSSLLALCLVLVALAVVTGEGDADTVLKSSIQRRAASSAICSTLEGQHNLICQERQNFSNQEFVAAVVHRAKVLWCREDDEDVGIDAAVVEDNPQEQKMTVRMDLHIVTQLAKALGVDSCYDDISNVEDERSSSFVYIRTNNSYIDTSSLG